MDIRGLITVLEDIESPEEMQSGDVLELELAEGVVVEATIVECFEDTIVINGNENTIKFLQEQGQHLEDDLEEQQGLSQRAQDAFRDLDATVTGSQPAGLDKDLDDFRQRARSGQSGKSTKLKDMNPIDRQQWEKEKQQHGIKNEAKYQGREVPLGKPMKGDVKKSKVYVKKPDGKVVKVNFGDKKLSIKKHIPGRRKNFRARHNCDNPGPRWKARYWSCKAW
jgi:hypothetical protein